MKRPTSEERRALIDDFIDYVNKPENYDLRFWQAVRNWSGRRFILANDDGPVRGTQDTFYWETKDGS